jgi:hypothetical protein
MKTLSSRLVGVKNIDFGNCLKAADCNQKPANTQTEQYTNESTRRVRN